MKIVIEIRLGNEAMRTAHDVLTAVTSAMSREDSSRDLRHGWWGTLRDLNGNTVGEWKVVDELSV